jgi:hypothetical protein
MVLLQANPSSYQSNAIQRANNEPSTEQDRIHACQCISLPTASHDFQYYLQAGCGLACAVTSAEMACFAEALSLHFEHTEALSWRFDHAEALPLHFDHAEALSLHFDHTEAVSLLSVMPSGWLNHTEVVSLPFIMPRWCICGDAVFADVLSLRRCCLCGWTLLRHCRRGPAEDW